VLFRVYVDEAGDRSISAASDDHFVVSAIIVPGPLDATVRSELADLRAVLGRHPGHVLHYRKFTHPQKIKAAQDIAASSVAAITNVIVHKDLIGQPSPAGNLAYISRPDPMYLWSLRLLLERISWYVDEHGGTEAIVTFAHVRHFPAQKLHNYRRALELTPGVELRPGIFDNHRFKIDSPARVELLQIADACASAIFRAVEPDQYGNTERRYLDILRPKLYRRATGNITSYGLKVFPSQQGLVGGPLDWLRAL
jgi:hypothetical protein